MLPIIFIIIIVLCLISAANQLTYIALSKKRKRIFLETGRYVSLQLDKKKDDPDYDRMYREIVKRFENIDLMKKYKVEHILTEEQIEFLKEN